jgi:hypothetical protein
MTVRGDINLGPIGLGTLASAGYIGDIGILFCPTSSSMPDDVASPDPFTNPHGTASYPAQGTVWNRSGGWGPSSVGCFAMSMLSEIRAFTSLDAPSLMHAAYPSWMVPTGSRGVWGDECEYGGGVAIEGSYNYRLGPCHTMLCDWGSGMDMSTVGGAKPPFGQYPAWLRLTGVSPNHIVWAGEPMFKSDKQLGGRAVCSDTFSRYGYDMPGRWTASLGSTSPYVSTQVPYPGVGWWGHRDGYNVLYGDWSCRWYGDQQQTIIWWLSPSSVFSFDHFSGTAFNTISSVLKPGDAPDASYKDAANCTWYVGGFPYHSGNIQSIWHMFDTSNGIDAGVDNDNP